MLLDDTSTSTPLVEIPRKSGIRWNYIPFLCLPQFSVSVTFVINYIPTLLYSFGRYLYVEKEGRHRGRVGRLTTLKGSADLDHIMSLDPLKLSFPWALLWNRVIANVLLPSDPQTQMRALFVLRYIVTSQAHALRKHERVTRFNTHVHKYAVT